MITLEQIIELVKPGLISARIASPPGKVTDDSRSIVPGDVFVAVRGAMPSTDINSSPVPLRWVPRLSLVKNWLKMTMSAFWLCPTRVLGYGSAGAGYGRKSSGKTTSVSALQEPTGKKPRLLTLIYSGTHGHGHKQRADRHGSEDF